MTPLPDGATSALDRLQAFAPDDHAPMFVWQPYVREALPGAATSAQRVQQARIARLQRGVRVWAQRWHLPLTHIEASAVFAAGVTPITLADRTSFAFARLIFWIYTLDSHIDRQDLTDLRQGDVAAPRAQMDRDLATAYAPLRRYLSDAELARTNLDLPWRQAGIPNVAPLCQALGAALKAWLRALPICWPGPPAHARKRLHLMAVNLATCVGMMRREFAWDCLLSIVPDTATLPTLETYLAAAHRSIGVYPVSALAATLHSSPQRAWRNALPAIQAGGRVVRLTNDLHTYATDAAEGNLTSVTITLDQLGLPRNSPPDSAATRHALGELVPTLDDALATFAQADTALTRGPLTYTLRHIVALALAIYGRGERYRQVDFREEDHS